jgi:hypothetical protein
MNLMGGSLLTLRAKDIHVTHMTAIIITAIRPMQHYLDDTGKLHRLVDLVVRPGWQWEKGCADRCVL